MKYLDKWIQFCNLVGFEENPIQDQAVFELFIYGKNKVEFSRQSGKTYLSKYLLLFAHLVGLKCIYATEKESLIKLMKRSLMLSEDALKNISFYRFDELSKITDSDWDLRILDGNNLYLQINYAKYNYQNEKV